MHLHTTQGHKDDCNKLNMSSNEVREPIHDKMTKFPDTIAVYIIVIIYYFPIFFISYYV